MLVGRDINVPLGATEWFLAPLDATKWFLALQHYTKL
jgi:hypothetical protein